MPSDQPSPKALPEREEAGLLVLLGGPVSAEANALVDDLMTRFVLPAMSTARRPSSITRQRRALGALLADLLDFHRGFEDDRRPLPGSRGMASKDYPQSKLGFGYSLFLDVVHALEAEGLLKVTKGQPRWRVAFGRAHSFKGTVTRFHLSPAMLELTAAHGVDVQDWSSHWCGAEGQLPAAEPDAPRLVLRSKKARVLGKKQPSDDMDIDPGCPRAQGLRKGIEKLNAFLAGQDIGGITFPGLRRIFNDGDHSDFAWNRGGRFYSLPGGHVYETMSADRRLERITLNGERVGEADIRASHITLLHAILDRPFDPSSDPYDVDGVDRWLVKRWCTAAIGSSNPKPRQWSQAVKDEYATRNPGRVLQKDWPMTKVGTVIKGRLPLLAELGTCGMGTLDLQFHESEILLQAMGQLMERGIPALPIHDGLIVGHSHLEEAKGAIVRAFQGYLEGVLGHRPLVVPQVISKLTASP